MKYILILTSFLVYACALPAYDTDPAERNDPQNYKNIEILLLESAVDQDGGYSYSFENDDGSKVSQVGEHKILDDEHAIESISGSYSYNDVNGQPVSLTYTADENGFRPMGAHLPTPPPIPVEILRSLRFLATAKPFVDEQLYDYVPKKKVYRGRQYGRNVVPQARNNYRSSVRSNDFPNLRIENPPQLRIENPPELRIENPTVLRIENSPELRVENAIRGISSKSAEILEDENIPSDVSTKSAEILEDENTPKTPNISEDATKQSALASLQTSVATINAAVKESIQKTSEITQTATKETAATAIAAIKDEAKVVTDKVKEEVNKINENLSEITARPTPGPVEESKELVEKYAKIASDIISAVNEEITDKGVEESDEV